MTPKEPFFAGTYFPKNQIGQRPGMLQIIPSLANAWSTKQIEINESIKIFMIILSASMQALLEMIGENQWLKAQLDNLEIDLTVKMAVLVKHLNFHLLIT